MHRLITGSLLFMAAALAAPGALALQDDPLCAFDPASCCVVENPDYLSNPFSESPTYLARDCCGDDANGDGALDDAVACCTDPNDPFAAPVACGCTDPLTGEPVACSTSDDTTASDCDIDPVSCFVPGEAEDPTDPPDSSGGWPFGSDLKLYFRQASLLALDPALFATVTPQVRIDCFAADPATGRRVRLATCPCDGTPVDLQIAGTAVGIVEEVPGLVDPRALATAACADVLLTYRGVHSDSSGGKCSYTRSVRKAGGPGGEDASAVVEPSVVNLLAACPDSAGGAAALPEPVIVDDGGNPLCDFADGQCRFPVGLERFTSDTAVAAALPSECTTVPCAPNALAEGQILKVDEDTGTIQTRLCSGKPEGKDPQSIACTEGNGNNKASRAGGTETFLFTSVSCVGDWKGDDGGVGTQVINPSGSNAAVFTIVSDGGYCDAPRILEVIETTGEGVSLNGVLASSCIQVAVDGTDRTNLRCYFDEAAVWENACGPSSANPVTVDQEVRTLEGTTSTFRGDLNGDGGFTPGANERLKLTATDDVRCKLF